jgi:hypothetical protein
LEISERALSIFLQKRSKTFVQKFSLLEEKAIKQNKK